MAWEASIRPVGRPKITEDDNLGFRRMARRFVVEGTRVTKSGLDKSVSGITISSGGTGYAVDDAIVFSGGSLRSSATTQATGKVATVDGSGAITSVSITSGGSGYVSTPSITITTAGGSAASLSVTMSTNLFLAVGIKDEEYTDYYLVHQYIESTTSSEKAILVREYAQLRDTWAKESIVETGEMKKLSRSYAVLKADNSDLSAMGTPELGYASAQMNLMPKTGQETNDSNDPWDLLPKVIQDTEPTTVSYEDAVSSPVTSPSTSADTTSRVVWARHVVVWDVSGTKVKLKVTGSTPYRLGTQPASGLTTYLEENTEVELKLGAEFMIIVDPTEATTRPVDDDTTYSTTDLPLYSTRNDDPTTTPVAGDPSDPRADNVEINNLDIDDISSTGGPSLDGFFEKATITPVKSMFAASKAIIGPTTTFDLTTSTFASNVQWLEDYVESVLASSAPKWIRASTSVDTTSPGVDLWTVSWAAPISPFWRTGGPKGTSNKKGPSLIDFDHRGLMVLRPQANAEGGNITFTWYNTGEQVDLTIGTQVTSEPSVSMDFHFVGADGNHRTLTFKQTFANACFRQNTSATLDFPTPTSLLSLSDQQKALAAGFTGSQTVAHKGHNSLVFTYDDPSTNTPRADRPLYQNIPLQSTGGHITWNNNFVWGGSNASQIKATPIYSHNKDRIWRLEATFT
tara:strand:+ start:1250 stop:3304 length:2055 start_codon:yes stop_codon:yes gene_type:complete